MGLLFYFIALIANFSYTYVIRFLPLFNAAVMGIFYAVAMVHPYNYRKNPITSLPAPGTAAYRQMHSMYYTSLRCIICAAFLLAFNIAFLIGTNVLYGGN